MNERASGMSAAKTLEVWAMCGAAALAAAWAFAPTQAAAQTPKDSAARRVMVRYHDGAGVVCTANRCGASRAGVETRVLERWAERGALVEGCYGVPEAALLGLMQRAEARTGRPAPDLTQCLRVTLPDDVSAREAVKALRAQAGVEEAWVAPRSVPRPDLPEPVPAPLPPTPDLSEGQFALDAPEDQGHGFRRAWERLGARGEGVRVVDIEAAILASHEAFPSAPRIDGWAGSGTALYGDVFDLHQHATAALGMITDPHDGVGTDGLAPEATPLFFTDYPQEYTQGVGGALLRALQHLTPGDVVLIEAQVDGPRFAPRSPEDQFGLVPVEWYRAEFDAIRVASDLGVIVVEPAGNGEQDLDDPIYEGRFDRDQRDSGAIVVCAGNPPGWSLGPVGEAMYYTNYGTRCDVQAYGALLVTPGYGDLYNDGDLNRLYSASYGGTSGASPLVTGAVVVLQSYARAQGLTLLPEDARRLLDATGGDWSGPAYPGPLLNVDAASQEIDAYTSDDAPPTPDAPGLGQRCEATCAGSLTCVEFVPGERYCVDQCAPFASPDACAERGLTCELLPSGEGECRYPRGDGVRGDACARWSDCATNFFCDGEQGVCLPLCSISRQTGCGDDVEATCAFAGLEFGDIGVCVIDESNPDGEPDGGPCAVNSDCQGGWCIAEWPEGYCTDVLCMTDDDCHGPDAVCVELGGGQGQACFDGCAVNADCRVGYTCQDGLCQEGSVFFCDAQEDCPGGLECTNNRCREADPGTNNGTTGTNNGTTTTNNSTTSTNNGTTSTNNGTTSTNNSTTTTSTNNATTSTNNATTSPASTTPSRPQAPAPTGGGSGCATPAGRSPAPIGGAVWVLLGLAWAARRRRMCAR